MELIQAIQGLGKHSSGGGPTARGRPGSGRRIGSFPRRRRAAHDRACLVPIRARPLCGTSELRFLTCGARRLPRTAVKSVKTLVVTLHPISCSLSSCLS